MTTRISISVLIMTTIFFIAGCNKDESNLIKDCPEEKIIDKSPTISDNPNEINPKEYYIYNGQRREINEFDNKWVTKNCNVKITEVY